MFERSKVTAAPMAARTSWSLALVLTLALAGCASTGTVESAPIMPVRQITFENTSNNVVRVYLVDKWTQRFIGRVQPGEVSRLTVPASFAINPDEQFSLQVVPLGAPFRGITRSQGVDGAMLSREYTARQLLSMRWSLVGGQLYSQLR